MNVTTALAANDDTIEADIVEQPINVDPRTGQFGIMTRPQQNSRDTGFIFINSGLLHRVGPFRLYVDIARQIARAGFPSIRLDQSGKGDSDPLPGVSLAETTIANLTAAATMLERETGAKRYVIGGLCSGADDALQVGSRIDGLAGMFMFDGYAPETARFYLQRFGPKIFSPRSWLNLIRMIPKGRQQPDDDIGNLRNWGTAPEMMERFRVLLDQGVRVLAIYSGWVGNCYVYASQLSATIGHPHAKTLVSELQIPDATHLFHLSVHRQLAVDEFTVWAERSFPDWTAD